MLPFFSGDASLSGPIRVNRVELYSPERAGVLKLFRSVKGEEFLVEDQRACIEYVCHRLDSDEE